MGDGQYLASEKVPGCVLEADRPKDVCLGCLVFTTKNGIWSQTKT